MATPMGHGRQRQLSWPGHERRDDEARPELADAMQHVCSTYYAGESETALMRSDGVCIIALRPQTNSAFWPWE